MLCQNCGKNEATTYYKENINGQVKELHLCPDCAAKLTGSQMPGFGSFFSESPFSLFEPMWSSDPFFGGVQQAIGGGRRCPTCGMTESELRRSGRAGCADCYTSFRDILLPYIKKLHGAAAHVGQAPASVTEGGASAAPAANPVEGLKAKLQQAIQSENYEEAARLRDEIKRLEA